MRKRALPSIPPPAVNTFNRNSTSRHPLMREELEALQAVGRGASELKMTSRVQARLLGLGLIQQLRNGWSITQAGSRMLGGRTNHWI